MYELIPVSQNSYYFSCPAKIGLYTVGSDAYLIDSGNNSDAAKKVLKVLDSMNLTLRAVLVTHSHADHIGGCALMSERTGCRIFSRGMEAAFTEFTTLKPSFLYGGFPPEQLRHKFLLAKPSKPESFTLPEGVEVIDIAGHSFDMLGYRMPDGTVFLGDVLSGAETLAKYPIAFLYDIKTHLETLERLESLEGKLFIPSHADPTDDISSLIKINREAIFRNRDLILSLTEEYISVDDLLAEMFEEYSLDMTFEQNALCSSTLRSYLSWMQYCGMLELSIQSNKLCAIKKV